MKTLLQYSVLFLSVSALMQACAPVMYSNVGQNVPLLKEKGDLFLQGAYSVSDGEETSSGGSVQFAYAVSDHWQINSSFYALGNQKLSEPEDWRGKGNYFELGGGYYSTSQNKKLVYELTGGIGFSGIKNRLSGVSRDHIDVGHFKPYLQPAMGFSIENFEFAFSPRIAYNTFTKKEYEVLDPNLSSEVQKFFNQRSNFLILEPGFTLRGGVKNFKVQVQVVFSSFGWEEEFINNTFSSIGVAFKIPSQKD